MGNSISSQHRKCHFDTHIFQFASFFVIRYQIMRIAQIQNLGSITFIVFELSQVIIWLESQSVGMA